MSNMTPQEREILNMVELGQAGEQFLASNLGGELVKRLQQDHDRAMSELLELNPIDAAAIRETQNRAKLPIMFLQYLNDIIEEGRQAEKILIGEEE